MVWIEGGVNRVAQIHNNVARETIGQPLHSGRLFDSGTAVAAKRTTHRSTAGKKLYSVRKKDGSFEDIQTYERAHGQDIKRVAKAEKAKPEK